MLKLWKQARKGTHSHTHVEQLLAKRGLTNRLLGGRLRKLINHSWQMYPVGVLFGLGFDTASEIGLLAMTAGAAAGNLPVGGALSLPILFAAGMSLMDTTDGVLMTKAYNWAFVNPLRKIFYNLTTTSLSIGVALIIGSIELLQVLAVTLHLHGRGIDFIAGAFLLTCAASVAIWKFGHFDQSPPPNIKEHEHVHSDVGVKHTHRYIE
jgi:nickel/cobalt transporter (NiCoT) family protein